MNVIQAISSRISTRTFNGLKPEPNILNRIESMCHDMCVEPASDEPECFRSVPRPQIALLSGISAEGKLGTYGVIKGATTFLAMACQAQPAAQILGGYILERIILECTRMGLDTCWIGGTFGRTGFQEAFNRAISNHAPSIAEPHSGKVGIITPLGHRTPSTRFAERMMRMAVGANNRKPFERLFTGVKAPSVELMETVNTQSPDTLNLTTDEKLSVALECLRLAPSSTNSQPWRAAVTHDTKAQSGNIIFTCARRSHLATYDMGIAYAHFNAAARYLGVEGVWGTPPIATTLNRMFFLSRY